MELFEVGPDLDGVFVEEGIAKGGFDGHQEESRDLGFEGDAVGVVG